MRLDPDLACCALFLIAAISGCSSSSTTTPITPHPTIVEVSPESFVGAPTCVNAAGAFRTYVATLMDVGHIADNGGVVETPAFALPSSALVPCDRAVAFGFIAAGHLYDAVVEGYDRTDLVPLAAGLPILLDPASLQPVAPHWKATCGRVRAEAQVTQRVTTCGPWTGRDQMLPATVRVAIGDALGDTRCGDQADEIERFIVRRDGEELGSAACADAVTVDDLEPDEFTSLEVLAFAAGANEPTLGTICSATPTPGIDVNAQCQPFERDGALSLEVPTVLSAVELRCDHTIESVTLALDEEAPIQLSSKDCAGARQYTGLTPGAHSVQASVLARGAAPLQVRCTADIEPGLVTVATCSPAEAP